MRPTTIINGVKWHQTLETWMTDYNGHRLTIFYYRSFIILIDDRTVAKGFATLEAAQKRAVELARTAKLKTTNGIQIYHCENTAYIFISDLPADERRDFQKWLIGQTRPFVLEIEPADTAFAADYERWKMRDAPDSVLFD